MKAAPLLITWHNENQAIYSVHYDPNGKGRVATAGLDNNVRVLLSVYIKHAMANPFRSSGASKHLGRIGRLHTCPRSRGTHSQSMSSGSVQKVP